MDQKKARTKAKKKALLVFPEVDTALHNYRLLNAEVEEQRSAFIQGFMSCWEMKQSKKKRIKALTKFKEYVHKRLDNAGIEKEPNGEHSQNGCRIGDRLDILIESYGTPQEG